MAETQKMTPPIAGAFERARAEGRVALIPYVMAGYPDLATSEALAVALCAAGADVLELGIPFSDPLADGTTIQHAGQRALEQGTSLADVLALAGRITAQSDMARGATPLALMTYYNPVYSYGVEHFCRAAGAARVAGLIVPDLPPEEAEPLRQAAAAQGIELIFLVAPTSTEARITQVAEAAERTGGGFVYCVALSGVTGARDTLPEHLATFVGRVRARTTLPLAVGFGVSRPEHVVAIGRIADGAVVASALLNTVDAAPSEERVAAGVDFLRTLQTRALKT
jgi:tryptophan synthase alpha chain